MIKDENVKLYQLVNGQEFMATYVMEDGETITFKSMLIVNVKTYLDETTQQEGLKVMFGPPTNFSTAEEHGMKGVDVKINKTAIAMSFDPSDGIYQGYSNRISKIVLAGR